MVNVAYAKSTHVVVCGDSPSVRIHAWDEMDPGGIYQCLDFVVPVGVFLAQEISQMQEQLSTRNLVSVHVGDVFHLRLHCEIPPINQICHDMAIS